MSCHNRYCTPGGNTSPGHGLGIVPVADAFALIRDMGMTCTYKDKEFRVDYRPYDKRKVRGDEGSAYFTNDAQDAIATARTMSRRS
jgi:hypothetical protein